MDKCNLLVDDIEVLGHTIKGNQITPAKEKIRHITDFPTPSADHGSTNRGGSHGLHQTATIRFVSW